MAGKGEGTPGKTGWRGSVSHLQGSRAEGSRGTRKEGRWSGVNMRRSGIRSGVSMRRNVKKKGKTRKTFGAGQTCSIRQN